MTEEERAEAWKSRALYEEDEKLRMEQRIADALSQTGRWFVQRLGHCANCGVSEETYEHHPMNLGQCLLHERRKQS